jgi:hypothetical protein
LHGRSVGSQPGPTGWSGSAYDDRIARPSDVSCCWS